MTLAVFLVLANYAAHQPGSTGLVYDSFIRDDVKPRDFPTLTAKAKAGRTHLSGSGSGFFITDDGYLLTNHHVVDGASEIVVVRKGTAYYADVRARSAKSDLALLKVNLFPRQTNGVAVVNGVPKVPCLSFASTCEVGQPVYVVGFPKTDFLGYEPKLTRGIVNSVSGYKDRKDLLQIDASLTFGNSGGPVVDEYGDILGVATMISTLVGGNFNCAVKYDAVKAFLPDSVKLKPVVHSRKLQVQKLARRTIDATVLVLVYKEGACERIASTEVDGADVKRRERNVAVKKSILNARLCKLRKEWRALKEITDEILDAVGEYEDAKEMNELARDELGLHLKIVAEADGRDVDAIVKPITGFRETNVACGKPTALVYGRERRGFPVEAKLSYEDSDWEWAGELKCVYNWSGTREIRVILKHVGKK